MPVIGHLAAEIFHIEGVNLFLLLPGQLYRFHNSLSPRILHFLLLDPHFPHRVATFNNAVTYSAKFSKKSHLFHLFKMTRCYGLTQLQ